MLDGLSKEIFEKFLDLFDEDREQAGRKYVALRRRLERFFEWRNCENTAALTDVVFDRVMKKMIEGEEIKNIEAYAVTVAKFVLMENRREALRNKELDENTPEINKTKEDLVDQLKDKRLGCLDKCLAELPADKKRLLISYFDTDERTLIPTRRRLADELGKNLNSLRIRVCRLKAKLEKCTKKCCENE